MRSRQRLVVCSLLLILVFCSLNALAEVRLPKLLTDHAVLQREGPIHIWGWSEPSEKITVRFHQQTRTASANTRGEWSLWLMPEHAGGPYTLSVEGSSTITLSDILVGDVWIASGQSNMEMPLKGFPGNAVVKNSEQEIAHADLPKVRLLRLEHKSSELPVIDIETSWATCTPETAADFSAVAYFFGREISEREAVPVGLIDATWGGTPVEAWISMDGIASDASLMPAFQSWAKFTQQQSGLEQILAEEKRQDAAAKAAGQPAPRHPWHPYLPSWSPAGLFNGMIAPETLYSIKGVIWYQGETNSAPDRAPLYSRLFPALINDWRSKWRQGNFPFLFVQISSFDSPPETWGIVRDAQRRTLSLTNTGMAVSLDIGQADNVHPPDKQTVGARLAVAARALAYGENVEYSGPLFRQATRDGLNLRVYFEHGAGLKAKGDQLEGFEVAGEDHKFMPAAATLENDTVLVKNPTGNESVYVRYGWANVTRGNLYNKAGLPASTFTSE